MSATATAPVRAEASEVFPNSFSVPRRFVPTADFLVAIGIVGDLGMVLSGLTLGYWLRFESDWIRLGSKPAGIGLQDYAGLIGLGALFLVLTFGYLQLYNPRKIPSFRGSATIILKGATFWLFAFLAVSFVMKFQPSVSRIYVFSSYFASLGTVLLWRWVYSRLLRTKAVAKTLRRRVLFIGWAPEASRITDIIARNPGQPYEVAGWIPAPLDRRDYPAPRQVPDLGDCTDLPGLLRKHEIDVVILTDPHRGYDEIVGLANVCEKELIEFKIIPSYFQILLSGLKLEPISGVPVLGVADLPLNRFVNRLLKRIVDVIGGFVGLILSAPIIAAFGALVRLESPGPIIFSQERIGWNGKRFKMYKLRTMRPDAGKTDHIHQSTLRDDPRVLRIGKLMRRWNLDEVPQFWNVLKGDMSLVGPRPERTYHSQRLSEIIPHYNARLASKPGITGWAQVNGLRGDTSLEERVRYDLHYLENWNLWFDFQTMFQTLLRRDNAY